MINMSAHLENSAPSLFTEIKALFSEHTKRIRRFVVTNMKKSPKKAQGYVLDIRKDHLTLSLFKKKHENHYKYLFKKNRLLKNSKAVSLAFSDEFITTLKQVGEELQSGKSELLEGL